MNESTPQQSQPGVPLQQSAASPDASAPTAPFGDSGQSAPLPSAPKSLVTRITREVMQYNKFIVGAVGAILSYLSVRYGYNHWVQDTVWVAMALGIGVVPNIAKE